MSEAKTQGTATETDGVPGPYTNVVTIHETSGSFQWVTGERPDKLWSFPVDFIRRGSDPTAESAAVVFASKTVQLGGGKEAMLGEGPSVGCVWTLRDKGDSFNIRANPYDKPNLPESYAVQVANTKDGNYYIDFDSARSRDARWNLDIAIKANYAKQVDLLLSGNSEFKLAPGESSFRNIYGNSVGVFIQGLAGPTRILYTLTQVADE